MKFWGRDLLMLWRGLSLDFVSCVEGIIALEGVIGRVRYKWHCKVLDLTEG